MVFRIQPAPTRFLINNLYARWTTRPYILYQVWAARSWSVPELYISREQTVEDYYISNYKMANQNFVRLMSSAPNITVNLIEEVIWKKVTIAGENGVCFEV